MMIRNNSSRVMFFGEHRVDPNQVVKIEKSIWGKSKEIAALVAKGELEILKSKKS